MEMVSIKLLCNGNSMRDRSATHKWQLLSPSKEKSITQERLCCRLVRVEPKERSTSCNSFIRETMIDNPEESWQSRAKPLYSVKAHWPVHLLTSGASECIVLKRCEKHFKRCEVGHEDSFAQKHEVSKECGFCELPDSSTSRSYLPSTNESDEDDVGYDALIDRAHKLKDCDERDQHHEA